MTASRQQSRRSSLAFERILDVAIQQIAADGFQQVRLANIAKAADVSVSLIHYHFATREALLEEALMQAYSRADRERELWERAQANLTHAQRLVNMVDLMLPGSDENHVLEWRLWFELWMQALRVPQLGEVAGRLYERWRDWWIQGIQDGIRDKAFKRCDPGRVADRVLALIDGYGVRVQIDPSVTVDWAHTEIIDYLTSVLGSGAGLADVARRANSRAA